MKIPWLQKTQDYLDILFLENQAPLERERITHLLQILQSEKYKTASGYSFNSNL